MLPSLSTLVGLVAGTIGICGFMPQVLKCWRSGDTAAISLRMFVIRAFGLVLWTIYGFAIGSLPVLIFSVLALILSGCILALKTGCVPAALRSPP